MQRKVGAVVVPIRLPAGPQPGGGALIVHGRRDGVTVAASDAVLVWAVARGALVSPPGTAERTATTPAGRPLNPGDTGNACSARRFVMYRERDGAVFLATSRLTDTW